MTRTWQTDGSEVAVWATDGTRVWGPPTPGPDPDPDPGGDGIFPATGDPLILSVRPDDWAAVYEVGADQPYTTISAAISAENARRAAAGIRGVGPQDRAVIRIHPGVYPERIGSPDHMALVGVSGNRDDVIIGTEVDSVNEATFRATLSAYVENVTFVSTSTMASTPPPGDIRATVWNTNAGSDVTLVFVNVKTVSHNGHTNSCAMQPGDRNTELFYKCRFEKHAMNESQFHKNHGFQPFNVQTGMPVRKNQTPELSSDVIVIDSSVWTDSEDLVAGVSDLGARSTDRVILVGNELEFDPSWQRAQYFHAQWQIDPSAGEEALVSSWVTPQVVYAGEATVENGLLHWAEPADLESSLPHGALGPKAREYYYPQALDTVGVLATGAPTATFTMQPGRWYFIPVSTEEARTLAGFSLDVTSYTGTGGTLRAALWDCPPSADQPTRWVSLGASSPLAAGAVAIGRGTYRNARMYPGEKLWVGVMADRECTVSGSSHTRAYWQDSPSAPTSPSPTPLPLGPAPAPIVKTGIV